MGTDATQLLNRAAQLYGRRGEIASLPIERLRAEAISVFKEAEKALDSAVSGESWYLALVPIALLASKIYQHSRFKAAIEKLQFSKAWLEKGDLSKTDELKRIAYKQSYYDAQHCMQLTAEELSKGNVVDAAVTATKDKIIETVNEVRVDFLIGAVIVGGLLFLSKRKGD